VSRDPFGYARTAGTSTYAHAGQLNPASVFVNKSPALRELAQCTQVTGQNCTLLHAVCVDGTPMYAPFVIARAPGNHAVVCRCVESDCFDSLNTETAVAVCVGFVAFADKNKGTKAVYLYFDGDDEDRPLLGLHVAKDSLKGWLHSLSIRGDHEKIKVSHIVPEEYIRSAIALLTHNSRTNPVPGKALSLVATRA